MYCNNCKRHYAENYYSCPVCGSPLINTQAQQSANNMYAPPVQNQQWQPVQNQQQNAQYQQWQPAQPQPQQWQNVPYAQQGAVKQKKKGGVAAIIIIAIAAALIITGVVTAIVLSMRVHAEDYVKEGIAYSGYNGYATVDAEGVFDYSSLYAELGNFKDIDVNGEYAKLAGSPDLLKEFITVSATPADHISNGDSVTVKITVDYRAVNALKPHKKLVCDNDVITNTFTVSGLPEPAVFDPFEAVDKVLMDTTDGGKKTTLVLNDGFTKTFDNGYTVSAGSKTVTVKNDSGKKIADIEFKTDASSYKSGGTVDVICKSEVEEFAQSGLVLSKTKFSYKPSTVSYVMEVSNMTKSEFNVMKDLAKKAFKKKHSNVKYVDAYFCYNTAYSKNKNTMYFLFSYKSGGKKRYGCIARKDIKITSDRNIVKLKDTSGFFTMDKYDSQQQFENGLVASWTTAKIIIEN